MRTKNRLVGASNSAKPPPHWGSLLAQVVERAKRLGQNTNYLEEAARTGKAEQVLRQMGVISPTDIDREFPLK